MSSLSTTISTISDRRIVAERINAVALRMSARRSSSSSTNPLAPFDVMAPDTDSGRLSTDDGEGSSTNAFSIWGESPNQEISLERFLATSTRSKFDEDSTPSPPDSRDDNSKMELPIDESTESEPKNKVRKMHELTVHSDDVISSTRIFPLCLCRDEIRATSDESPSTAFCQAISSVDGQMYRCGNRAFGIDKQRRRGEGVPLYRSHVRIPFAQMCPAHVQLLRGHHCCPMCGIFCIKGSFYKCIAGIPYHYFHMDCVPFDEESVARHEDGGHLPTCPHCGTDGVVLLPTNVDLYADVCEKRIASKKRAQMSRSKSSGQIADSNSIETKIVPSTSSSSSTPHYLVSRSELRAKMRSQIKSRISLPIRHEGSLLFRSGQEPPESEDISITVNDNSSSIDFPLEISGSLLVDSEHREVIRELIAKVKSTRDQSPTFDSISSAIENQCRESLLRHIINGVDLNSVIDKDSGDTPLHLAAAVDDYLLTYFLIKGGASVYVKNNRGFTPLAVACEQDNGVVVSTLLQFGAYGNCQFKYGDCDNSTPLHLAAANGLLDIAIRLLDGYSIDPVDVNAQDSESWTPLCWAVEKKNDNVAFYLLKKGADPLIKDAEGNICLHWAAYSGCFDLVVYLLQINKWSIDLMNNFNETPLMVAIREKQWEVVSHLLMHKANPLFLNSDGETAFEAIEASCPHEWIKFQALMGKRLSNPRYLPSTEVIVDPDISNGRENIRIPCLNGVNNARIDSNFVYVQSLVETTGELNINRRIDKLNCCSCMDDCTSDSCECTHRISNNFTAYDLKGRLRSDFNFDRQDTIFECNAGCLCNAKACSNRSAQKGIAYATEIFMTNKRGWAVRAVEAIPAGAFVCEYAGEILPANVADDRDDDSYLFEMLADHRSHCIDAQKYGNLSRFINHGCSPNLKPLKVYWDHQDVRFPHIGLYAVEDIAIGQELTLDYGPKFWIIKYKDFLCDCGSAKCKYSPKTILSFVASQLAERNSLKEMETT